MVQITISKAGHRENKIALVGSQYLSTKQGWYTLPEDGSRAVMERLLKIIRQQEKTNPVVPK
jgi:hypothetical protein